MTSVKLLSVLLIAFVLAILVMATATKRRMFVSECSVTVIGESGRPVENVRVSELWNAYSYDLSGGQDLKTDRFGRAVFPRQEATRSLMFWCVRPLTTRLSYGAHSSVGTSAFISVSEPGQKTANNRGFSCSNHECADRPLTVTLRASN